MSLENTIKLNSIERLSQYVNTRDISDKTQNIILIGEYKLTPPSNIIAYPFFITNVDTGEEFLEPLIDFENLLEPALIEDSNSADFIYYTMDSLEVYYGISFKSLSGNLYIKNPILNIKNNNLYLNDFSGIKFDINGKYILANKIDEPETLELEVEEISKYILLKE